MTHAPLPATRKSYWHTSRSPRYSLLFALPLLAAYEALAVIVNRDLTGGLRNGADVLLKSAFVQLAGARGPLLFGVLLVGGLLVVAVRDIRRHPGPLRGRVFLAMLAESAVLAVVFGIVVGLVTAQLIAALPGLAAGPLDGVGWPSALMV